MSERKVYLAGPITGTTYGECSDWRGYAQQELNKAGVVGVSPLRGETIPLEGVIEEEYDTLLRNARAITVKDRFYVQDCDLMLANLTGAEKVSIGTMIEYGWADAYRKPIITVIEPDSNLHDHPMLRELSGFRVEELDEGLYVAKSLLGDGN